MTGQPHIMADRPGRDKDGDSGVRLETRTKTQRPPLYKVLILTIEMRHQPFALWIKDLSAPDPYFILPVVMTLTTLLQTALNPVPPDPMQAKMMWFMPLIFSVMFFFFPAGLVLYWITNNVLSIAQQWLINTRMGVPPEFNLPKFKKT